MDRKKPCNCLNDCPCYPNCDQMMDEERGSFMRRAEKSPFDARMTMDGEEMSMRWNPSRAGDLTAEEENERDWQKLKEMYPDTAKRLFAEVENVCDSMEYEGSAIFDGMPDKMRVRGMAKQICGKMKDRCPAEETADLDDMAQVLLYQEMFHRRCRRRGCRRW